MSRKLSLAVLLCTVVPVLVVGVRSIGEAQGPGGPLRDPELVFVDTAGTIPIGGDLQATVTCPPGKIPTGGGAAAKGTPVNAVLTHSQAVTIGTDNGWFARAVSQTGAVTSANLRVQAICVSVAGH
jgi:hypothetical protein